jgi:hypothetical protein
MMPAQPGWERFQFPPLFPIFAGETTTEMRFATPQGGVNCRDADARS